MVEIRLPFPDYNLSKDEVLSSNLSKKTTQKSALKYFNQSWKCGKYQAEQLISNGTVVNFEEEFTSRNYRIYEYHIDNKIGNIRYYADIFPENKIIKLYSLSIKKWSDQFDLNYERSKNLVLAHEYFHYIEYSSIGFLSEMTNIPYLKIGNYKFGKLKFNILSEVGAYSFVNTLIERGVV